MNSHSDHTLHFEAVNSRNRAEVEHLEVFAEQSGFIESVTQCLQEADKLELWRPIGIYDRGMLIGFAMYGYFPEPAPGQVPENNRTWQNRSAYRGHKCRWASTTPICRPPEGTVSRFR